MPLIDIEILQPFCTQAMEGTKLTPAERGEVLRIAQGFACKDAAAAAGISPETIRARRKRIYRKLDVAGSNEVISALLARAVKMLARGERLQPMTGASPNTAVAPVSTGEVRASSVG